MKTKHPFIMELLYRLERRPIRLESHLSRAASKEKEKGSGDRKYEQYHGFDFPITALKAHQVGGDFSS